ncbi:type IV secretion system protein [Novosphingobium mangrovi (ex Hu et al. 2023)]|uniref:Type IV secretion system protein n=1 Tax=Novosphingobium mangrovi (ex Hu et al. 2023) TaxID=2930094 RepID=A0ABT0AFE7_9SPHN|nr:type IV secretion system protein [Novosphingobium mangrovi (ex Hu et al. 2023)]MCJ1961929.1 type IV secretion system protein [Novosphingobium mangrovi (ex Hu et al. 2023)]
MASDTCQRLTELASNGVAPALRAVDCVANEMAAGAFGRLFGSDGALVPAISILLALYIALFAFLLMTGRASVGVSSLMPRMITIGVVLLFTSSWLAYQGMVWSFALAGPDWIAGQLMGADGSATQIFADRIDIVFGVINEIGTNAGSGSGSTGEAAKDAADAASMMSPEGLMWMGAILLLLGTVGILLTARIALGILIALGPLFVILGLFGATRGLTAGWLRGMVLTAFTPLFVVMGGGIILELLVPIVSALVSSAQLGEIDGRAAMAFFTVAAVHVALMVMVFKVAGTMVSGWRVFGLAASREERAGSSAAAPAPAPVASMLQPLGVATSRTGHMSALAASHAAQAGPGGNGGEGASGRSGDRRTVTTHVTGGGIAPAGAGQDMRAKGIGSRFRSASNDTGRAPVKEKTR